MVPITWEVFRRNLLDYLFPKEKREDKFEEFINLRKVVLVCKSTPKSLLSSPNMLVLWYLT